MAVATIRGLAGVSPWRTKLLPANFGGLLFHVEAGSMEGGRRIVTHEFPKKEFPYSEDMGRKATEFTVRGYIIQFLYDTAVDIYKRDYTIARNKLQDRLDNGQDGILQLPMMLPMRVVCTRYRMTEEEKSGGYVTFDMSFVELGIAPFNPSIDPVENLNTQSLALRDQVAAVLSPSLAQGAGSVGVPLPTPRPPGAG
jgi:prophage DNA circulation protein